MSDTTSPTNPPCPKCGGTNTRATYFNRISCNDCRQFIMRPEVAAQLQKSGIAERVAKLLAYTTYHGGGFEDAHLRALWPGCPACGVFVDVGAGDPVSLSNTYHFERNGWTGLLIEADPRRIPALQQHRTQPVVHAAIVEGFGEERSFKLAANPDLSHVCHHDTAADVVRVPASRLEPILHDHNISRIDLLSIDVEGSELDVLRSFDISLHRPRAIIIEHDKVRCRPIMQMLAPHGYELLDATASNLILLHKSEA